MEEHLNPLAMTHLLQQTLRSLCIHENSQWVYAVFWRILPRNYPPPKWDVQGGGYDRSRGNRRNWILVWEDGFCNFAVSTAADHSEIDTSSSSTGPLVYGSCEVQNLKGLQPELFFKMSHEIYNYGEGLIGKVAADHSHKWTIALISVREGVVQLGAVNKVMEDLSYVVLLRKKFSYLESIPGVFLPHPSSSGFPLRIDSYNPSDSWSYHASHYPPAGYYDQLNQPMKITPSMTSLEALLSKLPPVGPAPSGSSSGYYEAPLYMSSQRPLEFMGMGKVEKEEADDDCGHESEMDLAGESSSSMSSYRFNVGKQNKGF